MELNEVGETEGTTPATPTGSAGTSVKTPDSLTPPAAENEFHDLDWLELDLSTEESSNELDQDFDDIDSTLDWAQLDPDLSDADSFLDLEVDSPKIDNEDLDILSILDIQLDSEEIATDQPRQLSKDQLTPTDWITELVPQDAELPTMADMLPVSTPAEPDPKAEELDVPNNVMDMLFGDTDALYLDENNQSVLDQDLGDESLAAPDSNIDEFEDLEMDSWLTDVMSDVDDVPPAPTDNSHLLDEVELATELPSWLDSADEPAFDADDDIFNTLNLQDEEASGFVNQEDETSSQLSDDNSLDSWGEGIDDDSLDWLTDDLDEEPDPVKSTLNKAGEVLQTRDLSSLDVPIELSDVENEPSTTGAVQAELPNWIKEMAPNANNESIIVPDEDNFQMNDNLLSEIIDAMESELNLDSDDLDSADLDHSDPPSTQETIVGKHTKPLSRFDMTAPELAEEAAHAPDLSSTELPLDMVSDLGAETDKTSTINLSDIDDFPEWLSKDDRDQAFDTAPTNTTDLPDWLRKPENDEGLSPDLADLGYKEAKIESIKSLSADEMLRGPADEIDDIISKHMSEELDPFDSDAFSDGGLGESDESELAQFMWEDIEGDFGQDENLEPEPDLLDSSVSAGDGLFDDLAFIEPDKLAGDEIDDIEATLFGEVEAPSTGIELDGFLDSPSVSANLFPEQTLDDSEDDFAGLSDFDWLDEELLSDPDNEEREFEDDDIKDFASDPRTVEPPELISSEPIDNSELSGEIKDVEDESLSVFEMPQTDDIDVSAWDEMDEALDLLVEFEDDGQTLNLNADDGIESDFVQPDTEDAYFDDDLGDLFDSIHENPPIEEVISAESLSSLSDPHLEVEPNDVESIEQGDDFFSSFADDDDESELPSWATELVSSPSADVGKKSRAVSDRSPLYGIENIVDIASVVANPIQDLNSLRAPQMMEPIAHRNRAHLAAQAAGTVPISDPTQPIVVPKTRQRYQPKFNPAQFDSQANQQKKNRTRRIRFLIVAVILALMVAIAVLFPHIFSQLLSLLS